jgi:hypothetical protein
MVEGLRMPKNIGNVFSVFIMFERYKTNWIVGNGLKMILKKLKSLFFEKKLSEKRFK